MRYIVCACFLLISGYSFAQAISNPVKPGEIKFRPQLGSGNLVFNTEDSISIKWLKEQKELSILNTADTLVTRILLFDIVSYKFILITNEGPFITNANSPGLEGIKPLLEKAKKFSFFMFTDIKIRDKNGCTAYLENASGILKD